MRKHLEWPQFGVSNNERRLIRMYEERIAALEATLKKAKMDFQTIMRWHATDQFDREACAVLSKQAADDIGQALTSSEGAGDNPFYSHIDPTEGRGECSCLPLPEPPDDNCPIHSPTNARESRE